MIEAFEGGVTDAETERRRKFEKLPKAIKMDETVMKINERSEMVENMNNWLFSSMIYQDVKQVTELVDVKILIWFHLLSRQHKSVVLLIQKRRRWF